MPDTTLKLLDGTTVTLKDGQPATNLLRAQVIDEDLDKLDKREAKTQLINPTAAPSIKKESLWDAMVRVNSENGPMGSANFTPESLKTPVGDAATRIGTGVGMGMLGGMTGGTGGAAMAGIQGALAPPQSPGQFASDAGSAIIPGGLAKIEELIKGMGGMAKFGARVAGGAGSAGLLDMLKSGIDEGKPAPGITYPAINGLLSGLFGATGDRISKTPLAQKIESSDLVQNLMKKLGANPGQNLETAGTHPDMNILLQERARQEAQSTAAQQAEKASLAYNAKSQMNTKIAQRETKFAAQDVAKDLSAVEKQSTTQQIQLRSQMRDLINKKKALNDGFDPDSFVQGSSAKGRPIFDVVSEGPLQDGKSPISTRVKDYTEQKTKELNDQLVKLRDQHDALSIKKLGTRADRAIDMANDPDLASAWSQSDTLRKQALQLGIDRDTLQAQRQTIQNALAEKKASGFLADPSVSYLLGSSLKGEQNNAKENIATRLLGASREQLSDFMGAFEKQPDVQNAARNVFLNEWMRTGYNRDTHTLDRALLSKNIDENKLAIITGNKDAATDLKQFLTAVDTLQKNTVRNQQLRDSGLMKGIKDEGGLVAFLGTVGSGLLFHGIGPLHANPGAAKATAAATMLHLPFNQKLWDFIMSKPNKGVGDQMLKWAQSGGSQNAIRLYPTLSRLISQVGSDYDVQ